MNAAQQNVEDAYNLIKSLKNGLTLDDLWSQVRKYSAPYSIAQLVNDGRIRLVGVGERWCCLAVEK